MKITDHFDTTELSCKCGCQGLTYDYDLIEKLEKLRNVLGDNPIVITSGYRCPSHSVKVGGTATDAHTKGIAADIKCKGYTSWEIAEKAEKIGFTGIGLINKECCHVDIRTKQNYINDKWFGNEMTGETIQTFQKSKLSESFYFNDGGKRFKITIEEII